MTHTAADAGQRLGELFKQLHHSVSQVWENLRRCFKPYIDFVRGVRDPQHADGSGVQQEPTVSACCDGPLTPLTDTQFRIWILLKGKALLGKELAVALGHGADGSSAIAHIIGRMRAKGWVIENARGVGYFRPDAPPPELASS
ncbi:MAG: hypothetical protein AAFS11_07890 [Planctomycetota bacterium]